MERSMLEENIFLIMAELWAKRNGLQLKEEETK